jgi:ubiquinone/menaquinone biosynthesis C-methylase UbiE
MQIEEYARMHELEDEYWWFVARRGLISTLLRDLDPPKPATILDIGCGTGAMLDDLSGFGCVIGADFSPEALSYCRIRGHDSGAQYRLARADARHLPFASNSIDIVTAMDIIEHIDDDKAALSEIERVLKPDGLLLATVPAYQSLWSDHDLALHHFRRYTSQGFRDVARRAGLRVEKLSYTISALFPFIWAYRTGERVARALHVTTKNGHGPKANLVAVSKPINSALLALCRIESSLVRHTNLPFGVTVLAVARKGKDHCSGGLR